MIISCIGNMTAIKSDTIPNTLLCLKSIMAVICKNVSQKKTSQLAIF